MEVLNWKKNNIDRDELGRVNDCLVNGGLVIFPTETVYGIGAMATDSLAVKKIFEAKGREQNNPLIVHLSDISEIEKYAVISNEIERKLIEAFMPGPFTIILKKKENIPNNVSANLDTVGIRVPSNYIANQILSYQNIPIAAPSANLSGKPSGTNVNDIIEEFRDKVQFIIDGNHTDIGLESTVVKVIDNKPVILRPGYVTEEDILKLIGDVEVDEHVFIKADGVVASPGMKYRHYAPSSKCQLVYIQDKDELICYIQEVATKNTVIIGSDKLKYVRCKKFLFYGATMKKISHNIFRLLREADSLEPDLILIEGVPKRGLGLAIMNRLIRTVDYDYIEK